MRVRLQKCGNSLAVRIPKSFAAETDLDTGSVVDLTLEDGRLVITPLPDAGPTLQDLLAEITPENLHSEMGTGGPMGGEIW
jgi:antitoxin MazE